MEKNSSPNTIASYSDAIRLLLCFACEHLAKEIDAIIPEDLSESFVLKYLEYLKEVRGNAPATRNQRLAVIKNFCRYLARKSPGYLEICSRICAISRCKTAHKIVDVLDEKEVNAIINAPDTNSRNGARDHAMLLFMYNTGARVQEVADLKIGDITCSRSPQVLITGKGQRQRVTLIWNDTLRDIEKSLCRRGLTLNDADEYLFTNAEGLKISRSGISYIVRKYTDIAAEKQPGLKNKNVSPHTFRHTTAMSLIRAGVDIVTIKEWLGHRDIKTTMLYLEIDLKMKEDVLLKFPPPISSKNRACPEWKEPALLEFLSKLCKPRYVE